jgi:hypothetical protein
MCNSIWLSNKTYLVADNDSAMTEEDNSSLSSGMLHANSV